jgi:hypothetical protein
MTIEWEGDKEVDLVKTPREVVGGGTVVRRGEGGGGRVHESRREFDERKRTKGVIACNITHSLSSL